MGRGGKILCSAAVLAVAACAGQQGKLEIRPTSPRLAAGEQPVSERVAEGRGQLALGNVGLALEAFRKAARDDPASTDALLGIAACYDRMGRFDLSRRNYEAALALAPADVHLLDAFAGSLSAQGRAVEAASVRREIAMRLAAEKDASQPVQTVEVAEANTVERPIASELAVAALAPTSTETLPEVQFASLALPVVATPAAEPAATIVQPAVASVPAVAAPIEAPRPAQPSTPEIGRSVTVTLPPPRPATSAPIRTAMPVATQQPASPRVETARRAPENDGPRIERLSMGVVALVTAPGPIWRTDTVSRTAQSTTVRFVPLRTMAQTARIRLLNAARVHRLAARTRSYLDGRGWRGVSIGDADKTRARSLILYPAEQRSVARKLSTHFGFAMAPSREVEFVTVLLGRDAARMSKTRTRA